MASDRPETGSNFLRTLIQGDLDAGRRQEVITRFPPEPNGYLHIGHAKAICVNFGLAKEFGGRTHLRFDDTNPEKEEQEYVDSIQRDVRWLGFEWHGGALFASDYFEKMYLLAEKLIERGLAYVDDETVEEIREHRGTVMEPGTHSRYRNRTIEENLELFRAMRAGDFPDGSRVLRAKIDMSHPNMIMRDPLLYRIRHAHHHRQGDDWCIYPMYDYAHCLEDALEGVTHSFCTLEFENNRPLYDWVIENTGVMEAYVGGRAAPIQTEFARLSISYTVTSKRKMLQLVQQGHVSGWDDPRMPSLAGIRRRGVPASAIRAFVERVGVAKANSTVSPEALDACIRDDLQPTARRVQTVLEPLALEITNWSEIAGDADVIWHRDVPYFWKDVEAKPEEHRRVPLSAELFIERGDFAAEPPKGWRRMAPGRTVRLVWGWVVECERFDTDASGNVTKVYCRAVPNTALGEAPEGVNVQGTIHWVSAGHAVDIEVRQYDRLFSSPSPGADGDFLDDLNPSSLTVLHAKAEPALAGSVPGDRFQFVRSGFYSVDDDSRADALVVNRIVELKSTWGAKESTAPAPRAAKPAVTGPVGDRPERSEAQEEIFQKLVGQGLSEEDADVIARDDGLPSWFYAAIVVHSNPVGIGNWLINEVQAARKEHGELPFGGAEVGALVALIDDGTVSTSIAKRVLAELVQSGGDPAAIVEEKGWKQVSDTSAIQSLVDAALASAPDKVAAYRSGRHGLQGFFVGQVMKASKGQADPRVVQELVTAALGA